MHHCTFLTLFHDHLQFVELVAETLRIVRSSTLQFQFLSHNSWNEESGEHFVEHCCTTSLFYFVDDEQIRLVFERVYDSKFEN
jgi:hypothetical protein